MYRATTGNTLYFLNQLESILTKLYKITTDIILCGDFNINYLKENSNKITLDSLLASYGLYSTIPFPTRIFRNDSTLIDNIFLNIYKFQYSVNPFINGLSDHEAQIITILNTDNPIPGNGYSFNRITDKNSVFNFTLQLSYENWSDFFFLDENVDKIFNNFHNIYFRITTFITPTLE